MAKSVAWILLHRIFSEKFTVACVDPQVTPEFNEVITGFTLSKITAVEALKSIVYPPWLMEEKLLILIT